MRRLLAIALLACAPAAAVAETEPKTLTLQNGSSFALQGWTRLNGTTAFAEPRKVDVPAEAEKTPKPDLQRRLRLEAEYQREKTKKEKKNRWSDY